MAALTAVRGPLEAPGKLGPSLRLMPTTAATTLRKSDPLPAPDPLWPTVAA